eukprot:6182084-Pleurochrysis_carterae.AAC.5
MCQFHLPLSRVSVSASDCPCTLTKRKDQGAETRRPKPAENGASYLRILSSSAAGAPGPPGLLALALPKTVGLRLLYNGWPVSCHRHRRVAVAVRTAMPDAR